MTARKYAESVTPVVYSVLQAGAKLGVSRATAYRMVASGELPSLRLRGRVVVPIEVVDKMVKAALVKAAS